jgi:hypothetical protein
MKVAGAMSLHYFSVKAVAFPLGCSHLCNVLVAVESMLRKTPKIRAYANFWNHEHHAPIRSAGIEPGHLFVHC